jgi:hypothetical protein
LSPCLPPPRIFLTALGLPAMTRANGSHPPPLPAGQMHPGLAQAVTPRLLVDVVDPFGFHMELRRQMAIQRNIRIHSYDFLVENAEGSVLAETMFKHRRRY